MQWKLGGWSYQFDVPIIAVFLFIFLSIYDRNIQLEYLIRMQFRFIYQIVLMPFFGGLRSMKI